MIQPAILSSPNIIIRARNACGGGRAKNMENILCEVPFEQYQSLFVEFVSCIYDCCFRVYV